MSKKNQTAAAAASILVIPATGFPATNLPFGVVGGQGVAPYKNKGENEFVTAVRLGKKEAEHLKGEILDWWGKNKTKKAPKEPDNLKSMFKKKDGEIIVYFKSKIKFDNGNKNTIKLIDGAKNDLDPEEFGSFGGETTGRVKIKLGLVSEDDDMFSKYLNVVQLSTFEAGGGANTEGFGDDGDSLKVVKPKKEKKKKKGKK